MKETIASRWRRGRERCAQAGGLLLAFALIGLSVACSRQPPERHLRTHATAPVTEARRVAEERKIRLLIERLTAVDGLEHVSTRLTDSCARPGGSSIFEGNPSPYVLICHMRAVAYFGVPGDIRDALVSIQGADIAKWGPQDDHGREVPAAAGTVSYALTYYRDHGRYPDGTLMSAPTLEAPGLPIDWDRAALPLSNRIAEPSPCPPAGSGGIYLRCLTDPREPMSVAAARARYGTVLTAAISLTPHYFTVPRSK